jgi:hypothetical protein
MTHLSQIGTETAEKPALMSVAPNFERGTTMRAEAFFHRDRLSTKPARTAEKCSSTPLHRQTETEESTAPEAVLSPTAGQESGKLKKPQPVYNLTVEGAHVFYANGILVHNCDAASQALSFMIFSNGLAAVPIDDQRRALLEAEAREQVIFLSESMYDVYDDGFF